VFAVLRNNGGTSHGKCILQERKEQGASWLELALKFLSIFNINRAT